MSLRYGLLGLLNYKSMTGYDLDAFFKKTIAFFWEAKTSQIYRELSSMEADGWLSSTIEIQTDRPNKKIYSITDKGRKEFQKWLSRPEDDIEQILKTKSLMVMRVFFGGDCAEEHTKRLLTLCRDRYNEAAAALNGSPEKPVKAEELDELARRREFFWKISSDYGKNFYKFIAKWSSAMLRLLERE